MFLLAQGRVPADRRGARPAPEGDRGVDRHGRAHARGGRRSCSRSTASGSPRRASRPTRSSPARARPARRRRPSRSPTPRAKREELLEQTRRDIEAETRRAIQEIRAEVADLTVLATEKVTRKTLTDDDQQRLVEEALSELDFASLAGERGAASHGRDRPGLRALAVRGRAGAGQARRRPRAARRSSPTRSARTATCRCSSSRPTSRRRRRRTGSTARVVGRRPGDPELPRAADREAPHAGRSSASARVRRAVGGGEQAAAGARSRPRSSSTRRPSSSIGDRIGEQTGRKVELSATVDPDDPRRHRPARRQLDPRRLHPQPPRTTSQAGRSSRQRLKEPLNHHADQARRDHLHPQEPHRGPRRRARPTSPRSAPCCRWPTASRASTASRTACRSRCSSCRTTSPASR